MVSVRTGGPAPAGKRCKCGNPAAFIIIMNVPEGSPQHEAARREGLEFQVLGDGSVDILLYRCGQCSD